MAEAGVIVAVRQSSNDLGWNPGITPPNAEAIRQIYGEDYTCNTPIHYVDATLVAASVDAGLLWWGFVIGLSVALVILVITTYWARWRRA